MVGSLIFCKQIFASRKRAVHSYYLCQKKEMYSHYLIDFFF